MSVSITVAKSAGFCFGVRRALDAVYDAAANENHVCTLGPIIHNRIVVDDLAAKGVSVIERPEDAKKGCHVILRSHGVAREVYDYLDEQGIRYTDATCPFVAKIHKLVSELSEDDLLLLAGDETHPEILGILGHCAAEKIVFSDLNALSEIDVGIFEGKKRIFAAAQTTFPQKEWEKCHFYLKKVCTKAKVFDTICKATSVRQQEAAQLAGECGVMIIVGDRHSSNTAKLAALCREKTRTLWVERADELAGESFEGVSSVGITAGASTPSGIIKEVHETMSEIFENQEELSFEEMLNQSFKSTYNGEKVTGIVTSIAPNEIAVDIGTKHAGYVPLSELTDDPNAKTEDIVSKGDELELLVVRVNDVEGTVMLSKKRLDAQAGFEKVMSAVDTGEILDGVVTEVIKGGVLALTSGVKVFIPASQATMSRNEDLNNLLKKPVQFKILEVNRQRRRAVGSIRVVAREARKVLEEQFWAQVEVGAKYTGTVKSLTDYGAFVDLGGVDGMVHISELSWSKVRHPSQVVSIGDVIDVFVKDIDVEKKKISLGYKKDEDNPWEILKKNYEVGQAVTAKVVSLTNFGAFAEIIPGIDGLIHISQISREHVAKPADVLSVGQAVEAKITELDFERHRVSLSIRALLDEAAKTETEE